jgi:type II secretory pathway component PulF
MPQYICKVIDSQGKTSEFVREAISEEVLLRELSKDNSFPLSIKETTAQSDKPNKNKKYKQGALLEFTNTLLLLLSSGITLKDALEIAQTIFSKGQVSEIINLLLGEIKKGKSIYEALTTFSDNFPPIFTGFVKIGEKVGSLNTSFKRLADYMGMEKTVKEKIIGALIYPIIVLSVAALGIGGIVFFLVPQFKEIYKQLGSKTPESLTSMTSILTTVVYAGAFLILFTLIAIITISILKRKNEVLAEQYDRFLLKIPFVGTVKYLKENLNFIYAMETLTESGFSVEDALVEASKVIKSKAIRASILRARDKLTKGGSLTQAFLEDPVFPERMGRWIAIGEKSGHVDQVFAQLRVYYQGELERWSTRFMDQIQPVLTVAVGGIVLMIILLFIVPMFSVYGNLLQ